MNSDQRRKELRLLVDQVFSEDGEIKIWNEDRLVAVLEESSYFEEKVKRQSEARNLHLFVATIDLETATANNVTANLSRFRALATQLGLLVNVQSVFITVKNSVGSEILNILLNGLTNLPIRTLYISSPTDYESSNQGLLFTEKQSKAIGDAIARLTNLEIFSMRDHGVSNDILKALSSLPSIANVKMKPTYNMDSKLFRKLLHNESLVCLSLQGPCILSASQVQDINSTCCQRSRSLSLSLALIGVAPDSMRSFVKTVIENDNITSVSVSTAMMVPRYLFCRELKNSFQSNKVKVKTLEIALDTRTELGLTPGDRNPALMIVSLMLLNSSIRDLQLRNFVWDETFSASLSRTLRTTSTLTFLELTPSYLDDKAWRMVIPHLGSNTSLVMFRLGSSVSLDPVTCIETAKSLTANTRLRSFNVLYNREPSHVPNDYIEAVKTLKDNTTLEEYNILGCNRLVFDTDEYRRLVESASRNYGLTRHDCVRRKDGASMKALEVIQKLNSAGRRYVLDDPASKLKGCEVLTEVIDDLDAIYYHLRENPILCDICMNIVGAKLAQPKDNKLSLCQQTAATKGADDNLNPAFVGFNNAGGPHENRLSRKKRKIFW